ncbi:MAG: aspartate 1-decarboxylase [Desulfovibrionaceae bacterium]
MALRCFLRAKLHRATITDACVDYEGSIGIDPELLRLSGIAPNERVDVLNVDNGERLTTYAIEGAPGAIRLNGAAAHKGQKGQRVIICAYAWLNEAEAAAHTPTVVLLGQDNAPKG